MQYQYHYIQDKCLTPGYMCICMVTYSLFAYTDHVNIVQNKSGYDVVNNSIVNAFNNHKGSIVLDCVTVKGHENALWEVSGTFDQSHYMVTIHNVYLSTITIVDPGVNISISLKCTSDTSKEYRIVTVTTGSQIQVCKCTIVILFSRKSIFEAAQ